MQVLNTGSSRSAVGSKALAGRITSGSTNEAGVSAQAGSCSQLARLPAPSALLSTVGASTTSTRSTSEVGAQ